MQREIRYRVWFEGVKKMVYFGEPILSNNGEKWGMFFPCDGAIYMDKNETMQYTGLKDKAGKPIYEGDILHDCEVEHGADYEVKFECAYCAGYDTDKKRRMFLHAFRFKKCEVIGNIYETPELLEVKL